MILVEAGLDNERGFEAKTLFATQLAAQGHTVIIDESSLPERADRNQRYEVAPFLANTADVTISRVILVGAEDISDTTLVRMRTYELGEGVLVTAIGRFADHQSLLGAQSRLAYALGREPDIVNLTEIQRNTLPVHSVTPQAVTKRPATPAQDLPPALFLFLPAEWLEEPATLSLLAAMDNIPDFRLNVLVAGKGKERIRESKYSAISVFGYGELGPNTLARRADLAVFYGDSIPGDRMASFAVELLAAGKTVIDCTNASSFRNSGAPALRGPEGMAALPDYLTHSVLVNLNEIGLQAKQSPWVASRSIQRIEQALGLAGAMPPAKAKEEATNQGRVVFLPTNGNGLGHAQRCTLIAAEIEVPQRLGFVAFPSCVPLIQSKGFACLPLVQKSADHSEEYANDIVNYIRLRRFLARQDHLVFDGGYVFDSIFRAIQEVGCQATWIRRGLWRPGQINEVQIERERVFETVIVPGEAFEELNVDYSTSPNIRHVGPVVQSVGEAPVKDLRGRLSRLFDVEFDELIVTMLGGGVAADRTAQLQSLCGMFDRRSRCLNLIVVWPNARVAPGLAGWKNSKLVRTRASLALCKAADLVVSAAGYNSFNELMYHGVPTVFIPQVAPYMDDQERRARAASERGLAETVLAHELLLLERAVNSVLDSGRGDEMRAALGQTDLPKPGNRDAATLIGLGSAP